MTLCSESPKRFLEAIILGFYSLPGIFMSKKENAEWHLKHICPRCSDHRKSFRDSEQKGRCLWKDLWERGVYNIPRDFGIANSIRYLIGIKTNLNKYFSNSNEPTDNSHNNNSY